MDSDENDSDNDDVVDDNTEKRRVKRQCRICHSCDENTKIISPCLCKGSARWVHQACLQVPQ